MVRPSQGVGVTGGMVFISGEQGNKCQLIRGTAECRQYQGTGNIRKHFFFIFGGTGKQISSGAQGNRYPLEGLNGDGLFFLLLFL